MSKKVINCIYAAFPRGNTKLRPLAVALGNYARDDGTRIFPSVATLAACTDQCERTVQTQLQKLRSIGWLQLVQLEAGGGRGGAPGRPREYRIDPDWLAAAWARLQRDAEARGAGQPIPWSPKTRADTSATDSSRNHPKTGAVAPKSGAETGECTAPAAAPEDRTDQELKTPSSPPNAEAGRFDGLDPDTIAESALMQVVKAYPALRVDLYRARLVWSKHVAADAKLAVAILTSVRWLTGTPEWQKENGRFVPKLSRWLRSRGWTDPSAQPPLIPAQIGRSEAVQPAPLDTPAQLEHRRKMAAQVKAAYHANRRRDEPTSPRACAAQAGPGRNEHSKVAHNSEPSRTDKSVCRGVHAAEPKRLKERS